MSTVPVPKADGDGPSVLGTSRPPGGRGCLRHGALDQGLLGFVLGLASGLVTGLYSRARVLPDIRQAGVWLQSWSYV